MRSHLIFVELYKNLELCTENTPGLLLSFVAKAKRIALRCFLFKFLNLGGYGQ